MSKSPYVWLGFIWLAIIYAWLDVSLFPFVFDDFAAITQNTAVQSPDPWRAIWLYAPERWVGFATYVLNFKLYGLDAGAFHVVNVVFHLAAVAAFFSFSRRLIATTGQYKPVTMGATATFATVLFALHPIQTAAVTYIHQRLAIIPTIMYFLGLNFWLIYRSKSPNDSSLGIEHPRRFLLLVLLCGLAGMFSKEMFVTFPLAILVIDWITSPQGGIFSIVRWRRMLPVWALLCLIPASFMARYGSISSRIDDFGAQGVTSLIYLLTQVGVFWQYLGIIFFITPQNADHDVAWQTSWTDPTVISCSMGIVVLLGLALFVRRSRPVFSVGILLMFVGLLVESTIVPIRDAMFEHRMYLPSGGLFLAIADIAAIAVLRLQPLVRRIAADPAPRLVTVFIGAMIAAGLVSATMKRNEVWSSSVKLWADVVEKSPRKARGYINLAASLIRENRPDESLMVLTKLLDFAPGNADGHYLASMTLLGTGQTDLAEKQLGTLNELVTEVDPRVPLLRAKILIRRNRSAEALTHLERCLALLKPPMDARADFSATAYISYVDMLIAQGNTDQAVSMLKEARSQIGETSSFLLTAARLAFVTGNSLEGEKSLARLSTRGHDQSLLAERELGVLLTISGDKPRAVAVLEQLRRKKIEPDPVTDAFFAANFETLPVPWTPPTNCRDIPMAGFSFLDAGRTTELSILKKGTVILCEKNAECSRCQNEIDMLHKLGQ